MKMKVSLGKWQYHSVQARILKEAEMERNIWEISSKTFRP